MKKIIILTFLFFALLSITACGDQNASTNTVGSDEVILFVSQSCGHCANVKKYISDNNLKGKVSYQEVEAWDTQEHIDLFNEKSDTCDVPKNNRGVPLLYTKDKCYSGEVEVMNYFKKAAGL